MAPQTPVGSRERFRERSRNRSRARIYILALRSKLRHRVDKVKMVSRLGGEKEAAAGDAAQPRQGRRQGKADCQRGWDPA